MGYRHIDTACSYGNENAVGKVLNRWISEGKIKREDVFVTTKLPIIGVHPDRIEMFIKKSLANLGLDYVDLYLIHFPVGCKYRGDEVYKPLKKDGQADLEGRTDFEEIWKV